MGSPQKSNQVTFFQTEFMISPNLLFPPLLFPTICVDCGNSLRYTHWLKIVSVLTSFLFLAKTQFCYYSVKSKSTSRRTSLLVSTRPQRFCQFYPKRFIFLIRNCTIKSITFSSEVLGPENTLHVCSASVVEKVSIVKYGRNKHVFF